MSPSSRLRDTGSGLLSGKTALVTGAASGIGKAIATVFVHEGAYVLVADIDEDGGRRTAAELGSSAEFHSLDVSKEDDWETVAQLSMMRNLDILVNNAAVVRPASLVSTPSAEYQAVSRVIELGTFLGMRFAAPLMKARGGGSIVNISSIAGVSPKNGLVSYASSKFAVRGMTKVAALELGRYGIRVNTVIPGNVETPMLLASSGEEERVARLSTLALGRLGEPNEIAYAVTFLASELSSYCTGGDLTADGGYLAGRVANDLPGGPE
jgi:3alpha(or 20beta)-hydroxysteroid dehydrogenase